MSFFGGCQVSQRFLRFVLREAEMGEAFLGAELDRLQPGRKAEDVFLPGILYNAGYAAAMVLGWPVLAMAVVGLAEAILNIRSRVARKRGPPSLRT